jgi:hypothetical protein
MKSPATIYSIDGPGPGRLAIVPRPRGGEWLEDEACAWQHAGVDLIVSLLTADEVDSFDLTQEGKILQTHGLRFFQFPIVDRSVPSSVSQAMALVEKLEQALAAKQNVAIHCRQSIGRSALIAASVLVLQGVDAVEAFRRIGLARGLPVPETDEQREWVVKFVRALAGVAPQH